MLKWRNMYGKILVHLIFVRNFAEIKRRMRLDKS